MDSARADANDATAAISVRQLCKTFPNGVEAVRNVEFDVEPGEVFGLLGPNGAGKSTTVGMLTTTVAPTAGRAWVAGFDVAREPGSARRASAVVFQDTTLDRPLPGRRNLDVHARLWGLDSATAARRIADVVDAFNLGGLIDRQVETYSGGERRRLEIARALISQPQVLFLDEPTVGLDPRVRSELQSLLADLRTETDVTVLLTTHYLEEAEDLCDRVAIMNEGRIVDLGTPDVLLSRLGREIVEVHVGRGQDPDKVLAELRRVGLAGDDTFVVGSTVRIPLHDGSGRDADMAVATQGLPVGGVASRPPTLDDVYLQLTGRSLGG